MKPRSQSLNHAVCVTMATIDAVPTSSVQRNATTWSDLRVNDIRVLERLSDAEVQAEPALLGFSVDEQPLDGRELIADVHPKRSDRRQVPEARTHGIAQIREVDVPGCDPDVAVVEERNAAQ